MERFSNNSTRLHYDLSLQINPETSWIGVTGNMVYHAPQDHLEQASFYLHRQFDVNLLTGSGIMGYQFEKNPLEKKPDLPDAGILKIYFDPPLSSGKTALVQFRYEGYITDWPNLSANVVEPDWVELGAYLPWYPLLNQGSSANLTFSLQVACPPEFSIASFGSSIQQNGTWYFNWVHSTNDIIVTAGRNLHSQVFESETNRVLLHSSTFSRQTAQLLGEDLLWTLDRFAGWFGPIRPAEFTLIESSRAEGGGYARRGLVVLGRLSEHEYLDQRLTYLRYLAHEAAHAWWWGAPTNTWEDWLNESFAEFSALLVIQERYGIESFNQLIHEKVVESKEIPPLWEFDRIENSSPASGVIVEAELYQKGPLLLYNLVEKISHRRFLDLCRGMHWGGVQNTAHFLALLEELEGKPTRDWMEAVLKEDF